MHDSTLIRALYRASKTPQFHEKREEPWKAANSCTRNHESSGRGRSPSCGSEGAELSWRRCRLRNKSSSRRYPKVLGYRTKRCIEPTEFSLPFCREVVVLPAPDRQVENLPPTEQDEMPGSRFLEVLRELPSLRSLSFGVGSSTLLRSSRIFLAF